MNTQRPILLFPFMFIVNHFGWNIPRNDMLSVIRIVVNDNSFHSFSFLSMPTVDKSFVPTCICCLSVNPLFDHLNVLGANQQSLFTYKLSILKLGIRCYIRLSIYFSSYFLVNYNVQGLFCMGISCWCFISLKIYIFI